MTSAPDPHAFAKIAAAETFTAWSRRIAQKAIDNLDPPIDDAAVDAVRNLVFLGVTTAVTELANEGHLDAAALADRLIKTEPLT